jgi:hypothetical protein
MKTKDSLTYELAAMSRITDQQFAELAQDHQQDELFLGIVGTRLEDARPARRWHRLAVIATVSITAIGTGGAIGWAMVNRDATNTVAVQCIVNGTDSIVPATSGDPIADCAALWKRETGSPAPQLQAHDNGHGGVTVAASNEQTAPESSPLPRGAVQNVSLITLQEGLDDYIVGLPATCRSTDSAVAFVHERLDAAGLGDWSVSPPPNGADGASTCAHTAIVEAQMHSVLLRALDGPTPTDLPFMRLAQQLRQLSGCDSAGDLAKRVRAAAAQVGMSEAADGYQLTTVAGSHACATVHETVGGTIMLTVRG